MFEFFRNTAMDARNYFLVAPVPKQVLKQNQFGATLGGPIVKDRTFFFFSYEGLRSVEQSAGITNVLTPAEENGDFSALLPEHPAGEPLYRACRYYQQSDSRSIQSRRISPRTTCRCRTPTRTARTTPTSPPATRQ